MSLTPVPANVGSVNAQTGAQLQARRIAIGMTIKALAEHAGVDRGSLSDLEKGKRVQLTTVGAVDKALTELEHEMGMDLPSQVVPVRPIGDPAEGMVEFEIAGNFGVKAVIKGPVSSMAELQEAARRLIADMGQDARKGEGR